MNNRLHARLWRNRKLRKELHDDRNKLAVIGAIVGELGLTDYVEQRILQFNKQPARAVQAFLIDDVSAIGPTPILPPVLPASDAEPYFRTICREAEGEFDAAAQNQQPGSDARNYGKGRASGAKECLLRLDKQLMHESVAHGS